MTQHPTHSTAEPPATALLFALQAQSSDVEETRASLDELEHLLRGLGVIVGPSVVQQRDAPAGALVLGAGKLEELRELLDAEQERAPGHLALVFDGELLPGQQRSLSREFDVEVLDRTQVILRVFAQRARSKTAKLEIELAQLQYEAPRIRDDDAIGTRQAGGGGRAAKGHTSVELRKQLVRQRVATIRKELEAAASSQRARRERRQQVSRVALVGYTNAGKSSWMRRLTGAEAYVQDALFATLDTTVRALHPPATPRIVVADTVGFLRRLPNHLLASFRSTLDEALDADLLCLVVDGADPEWEAHYETTEDVLVQVNAVEVPKLVLVNKRDRMTDTQLEQVARRLPAAVFASSRSNEDVVAVRERIVEFFDERLQQGNLLVPHAMSAMRAEIWDNARVVSERYDEAGGHLTVRAEPAQLAQWQQRLKQRDPSGAAPTS